MTDSLVVTAFVCATLTFDKLPQAVCPPALDSAERALSKTPQHKTYPRLLLGLKAWRAAPTIRGTGISRPRLTLDILVRNPTHVPIQYRLFPDNRRIPVLSHPSRNLHCSHCAHRLNCVRVSLLRVMVLHQDDYDLSLIHI